MFNLIKAQCNCALEEEALDQDHLLCDQSQLDNTVFRAEITTNQLAHDDLLVIIQNVIASGRLMLNESRVFTLDNTCPIEISSFSDSLCVVPVSDNIETESNNKSSPTGAIVGSITTIFIIILLLIAGIVLVLYWRSKHR